MELLNKKQMLFCHKLIELNFNQTKAYMAAYPDSKEEAARSSASALLINPNIQKYLALLTEKVIQNSDISKEQVIKNIKNDSDLARMTGQFNVSMKGNELLAKHLGMLTDNLFLKGSLAIDSLDKDEIEALHKKTKK